MRIRRVGFTPSATALQLTQAEQLLPRHYPDSRSQGARSSLFRLLRNRREPGQLVRVYLCIGSVLCWRASHSESCFLLASLVMPYASWIMPARCSRLPATTSRSSSVSLPHCCLALPLNCFQLPAMRFQFICWPEHPPSTKTPPKRGLCIYDSTACGGIFDLSDGHIDSTVNTICACSSCRSMHREPFRCRYSFLRQREFQHAVVVLGLGGRFVDLLTERERALDLAVIALGAKHSLAVLDVFFVLHFRGYRNFVAVDGDVDVFLLDAGQFGQHLILLVVLAYVHAELRRRGRARLRVRQPHGDATEPVLECILERIVACDVYHFDLL